MNKQLNQINTVYALTCKVRDECVYYIYVVTININTFI